MKLPTFAKLKPTGKDWFTNIPHHWGTTRMKWVGDPIIGLTYSPNDVVEEDGDGMLVLRSSNIQGGRITFDDNVYVKM